MFDLGASELLLIVIVAVVVIGPKDLPLALRTAGQWIGKLRKVSGHFRAGLDAMVREAEMDEMEKKWKAQNARIMAQDPASLPSEPEPTGALPAPSAASQMVDGGAESAVMQPTPTPTPVRMPATEALSAPAPRLSSPDAQAELAATPDAASASATTVPKAD